MPDTPKQRAPLISIGPLDLADAVHVGLAAMVGGGVFTALALGSDVAGPAVLVSIVIAGLLALISGLACTSLARPALARPAEFLHPVWRLV